MTVVREPTLKPVNIEDLRPTQITVGMREVEAKRKRWREKGSKKELKFLEDHMIPVIFGPKGRHYIIDHHHLARALHEEGSKDVLVTVVANLSKIDKEAFWVFLDNRSWLHPFDEHGRRRDVQRRPKLCKRARRRSLPKSCRRVASDRRVCQGHNPIQRVSVGRFFTPAGQAETGRRRFWACSRKVDGTRKKLGCGLLAWMVRAPPGLLAGKLPAGNQYPRQVIGLIGDPGRI